MATTAPPLIVVPPEYELAEARYNVPAVLARLPVPVMEPEKVVAKLDALTVSGNEFSATDPVPDSAPICAAVERLRVPPLLTVIGPGPLASKLFKTSVPALTLLPPK